MHLCRRAIAEACLVEQVVNDLSSSLDCERAERREMISSSIGRRSLTYSPAGFIGPRSLSREATRMPGTASVIARRQLVELSPELENNARRS